uniref:Peptidase A1 domain-containing protein n=1 Tax=Fagus sylvatica TaxID=28930 RepID=A0A2N9H3A3_FAGSY
MVALPTSPFNLFLLSCFTSFALLCFTTTPTIIKPRRYVTKLIHHDSVHSPYYNPMATVSERARRAIDSSSARLAYLRAKAQGISLTTSIGNDDMRAGVIAATGVGEFLANISIGEPPIPQLLSMDTGSQLTWIQCQPCTKCFKQDVPIFNPSKSSTYMSVSNCTSPTCLASPGQGCEALGCTFYQKYADRTTVSGLLATEKMTFETSDEGIYSIPNIPFGSKFSYCFGRIRDPQYIHNQLVLGDGAEIEGPSTPLEILDGLYYLTLEGISVDQENLDISPEVFKRSPYNNFGGVIIDSGSSLTSLARDAFNSLNNEVQRLTNGLLEGVKSSDRPGPCYKGVINRDLIGFPVVTFHFANGVDLVLDIESMFHEIATNQFCMACCSE